MKRETTGQMRERMQTEAVDTGIAGMRRARIERLEDTVIALAAFADHYAAKVSPHYPPALNGPLPLADGDLDGLWFGTWEATAEARKNDPRYRNQEGHDQ